MKRTYEKLLPGPNPPVDPNHSYTTEIKSLDKKTGGLVVDFETYSESPQKTEVITIPMK